MPFVELNGFRHYYEIHGSGPPLLFLHGFTLDCRMWHPNMQELSQSFRCILLDSRGHGKSDSPSTGYHRDQRSSDVIALLNKLGLETVHLLGMSMGGSTAIGCALSFPERLRSLILVSAGVAGFKPGRKIDKLDEIARTEGIDVAKRQWLEWSTSYHTKKGRNDIASLITQMIEEHSGAIWSDPMRGKYPVMRDLERLKEIELPTLIVVGTDDKVFCQLALTIHEYIRNSILETYSDTGHLVNLEWPKKFDDQIRSFVNDVELAVP